MLLCLAPEPLPPGPCPWGAPWAPGSRGKSLQSSWEGLALGYPCCGLWEGSPTLAFHVHPLLIFLSPLLLFLYTLNASFGHPSPCYGRSPQGEQDPDSRGVWTGRTGSLFSGTRWWAGRPSQSPAGAIREDFPEEVTARLLDREEDLLCISCPHETGAQGPPDGQLCIAPGAEFEITSCFRFWASPSPPPPPTPGGKMIRTPPSPSWLVRSTSRQRSAVHGQRESQAAAPGR